MSLYRSDEADPEALGEYYTRHVDAMTGENLHSKAEIAAELGMRDKRIAGLEAKLVEAKNKIDSAMEDIRDGLENDALSTLSELCEAIAAAREALVEYEEPAGATCPQCMREDKVFYLDEGISGTDSLGRLQEADHYACHRCGIDFWY